MEAIHAAFEWLDTLMPEGIHPHTSTVISGPGGSGKPLIGNAFAITWLQAGGSVVFMPLQYPSTDFVFRGISTLGKITLDQYLDHVSFLILDPTIEALEAAEEKDRKIKANLIKPEVWDTALERACSRVPDEGPGILVLGSALNLLLFSPKYAPAILEKMQETLRQDKRRTYVFSISTSAKKDQAAQLEEAADNLLLSRSVHKPEFQLFLRVVRLKEARFSPEEIQVPIPAEALEELRAVAEHSRSRMIPLLRRTASS